MFFSTLFALTNTEFLRKQKY